MNFRQQIDLTIQENNLEVLEIRGFEKDQLIKKIKNEFVHGNPRALWLNFKYVPTSIAYEGDYPHTKITSIFAEPYPYFFLIDNYNVEYYLFLATLANIIIFIENCLELDEYYLFNLSTTKMLCETDHGDLLYIDVTQHKLKGV